MMHDLINEIILSSADRKVKKEQAEELIDKFCSMFPKSEHLYAKVLDNNPLIQSHLERLLSFAEGLGVSNYKILELRRCLLVSYFNFLNYKDAKRMMDWFKDHKSQFSKAKMNILQKESYATFLINIAQYQMFILDKPQKAYKLFEESIDFLANEELQDIAYTAHMQYAQTLVCSGQLEKAEPYLKLASVFKEKALEEVDLGSLLFTEAIYWTEKGGYKKAKKLMNKTLEGFKGQYDASADSAREQYLITVLRSQEYTEDTYQKALSYYDSAQSYFPADTHDMQARAAIFLAWAELGLKKYKQASEHINQAKKIFKSNLENVRAGGEFMVYLYLVEAMLYEAQGEHEKAFDTYRQTRERYQEIFTGLKTDLYGTVLKKLVSSAKAINRKMHSEHYSIEYKNTFGASFAKG